MGHFNERIDRARLHTDPEYLARVACEQFKQNDRYHRGLLTAQAFSRSLEDLGLKYGQKEVDDILQFCTITDDGYVHYKDLIVHCSPEVPRAKQSSMKSTIFPEEEESCYAPSAGGVSCRESAQDTAVSSRQRMFLAERQDDIRQAYARWDRGLYSNDAFKAELQGFGLELTHELKRLLEVHNRARNMKFGELMAALEIEENDGRRARVDYPGNASEASQGYRPSSRGGEFQRVCSSSVTAATRDIQNPLRQAICEFVDGRIPAVAFRRQLRLGGVPVPPELDRLIRTHEQASSVTFQDFARQVLRQDRENHMNGSAAAPTYSGPPTPSGGQGFNGAGPFAVGGNYGDNFGRPPSEAGSVRSSVQAHPVLRAPYASDDYQPPTPSGRSGRSTPNSAFPVFRPPSEVTSNRPDSASGVRGIRRGHGGYEGHGHSDMLRWDEKQPSTGSTPSGRGERKERHEDRHGDRHGGRKDRQSDSASGYRQGDSASGYCQSESATGYRQGDSASGYRQSDSASGYRQGDSASGYRQSDSKSDSQSYSASGYRQSDRQSERASGARTPPPKHRGPNTGQVGSRDMADCLSWPAAREGSNPGKEQGRPGKRYYGDSRPAQEILPWAQPLDDPDDSNNRKHYNHVSGAPFGTDADQYRRPEDAGTAEYLPANQINPRHRPF